jgi:hypothetical protein
VSHAVSLGTEAEKGIGGNAFVDHMTVDEENCAIVAQFLDDMCVSDLVVKCLLHPESP